MCVRLLCVHCLTYLPIYCSKCVWHHFRSLQMSARICVEISSLLQCPIFSKSKISQKSTAKKNKVSFCGRQEAYLRRAADVLKKIAPADTEKCPQKSSGFDKGTDIRQLSQYDLHKCTQMSAAYARPVVDIGGWSGGSKVLCILHHWGVQLILACSWARPAILVVGKGRGGMFLFLLFLHFHSCSSFFPVPLFHLLYSLFYLFSPFLWETTQMTLKGWRVVKPQHNQMLWTLKVWAVYSRRYFGRIWIKYCLFHHKKLENWIKFRKLNIKFINRNNIVINLNQPTAAGF